MPVEYKRFKGTKSQYRMLHLWVEKISGRPNRCDRCGETSDRRYEWANISGEYKKDINDWQRLCVPCHCQVDMRGYKTECKRGHDMKEVYIYPSGRRECKICRALRPKLTKAKGQSNE